MKAEGQSSIRPSLNPILKHPESTLAFQSKNIISNSVTNQQTTVTKKTLESTINGLNQTVKSINTHLKFKLHEGLGEYYVNVVNDMTGEIVKEIPSKEFLDRVQKMFELAGLIVDEKL